MKLAPMDHRRPSAGLTLMELAIALVVVGLLSGGILLGRMLIAAASIRAQIIQIEDYDRAVGAFRLKYDCLPGDCENAETLNLGQSGDGNGEIDKNLPCVDSESVEFWQHLSNAGMITPFVRPPGLVHCIPGKSSPPTKLPGMGVPRDAYPRYNPTGGIWVMNALRRYDYFSGKPWDSHEGHSWLLSGAVDITVLNGIFSPSDSFQIDQKTDDGFPLQGRIKASCMADITGVFGIVEGYYLLACTTSDTADARACVDNSVTPALYNLAVDRFTEATLCSPTIEANF